MLNLLNLGLVYQSGKARYANTVLKANAVVAFENMADIIELHTISMSISGSGAMGLCSLK